MSAAPISGLIGLQAASQSRRTVASMLSLLILAGVLAFAPLRWALVGVLVVALSAAMMIQPAIGLVLIAIAIPWGNTLAPLPIRGIGVVDLLVGAVLVTWLARSVMQREIRIEFTTLFWPLLVFVWVSGASLTQAVSWREGLPEWLKWIEFAALYVVSLQILNRRSALILLAALLATGVSQAFLGAYQFANQIGPEGFILMGRYMRAYGSLSQPNPYAGYLGYLAPIATGITVMALAMWQSTKQPKSLIICVLGAGITFGLVAGIFLSWSRGAWLGLAASLLVVIGLTSKRRAVIVGMSVTALVLVFSIFGLGWLPDSIVARVQDLGAYIGGLDPANTEITDENFSVLERLAHWRAGWLMFENEPWLGVGIGNYAANFGRYPLAYWYDPLGHAHNVFVNFLAETGILGLGAFLGFWLAVVLTSIQQARYGGRSWGTALAVGLVGTWTYLTIHSLFDNLFVAHLQLQLALLLAVLFAMQRSSRLTNTWQRQ